MEHTKPLYSIGKTESPLFSYKTKTVRTGDRDGMNSYDELKIVRIRSGSAIWTVNGRDIPVEPNDILIFSRADLRRISAVTGKQPITLEQILFLPIAVYPARNCIGVFYARPSGFQNKLPKGNENDRLQQDFDRIREEIRGNRPFREEAILSLLSDAVLQIARLLPQSTADPSGGGTQYETVRRILEYLDLHHTDPVSRDSVAREFGLSPSHFSRTFHEYTGFCFQEYLAYRRVQTALNRIEEGTPVLEAALAAGFGSSSGFYSAVKRIFGSVPTSVRAKKTVLSAEQSRRNRISGILL